MLNKVFASDFSIVPDIGEDCTGLVLRMITETRTVRQPHYIFTKGTYHFYPYHALRKYCAIINQDNGEKLIAIPIEGRSGTVFSGGGSRFIFHGPMMPFFLENGNEITLQDFTIDWHENLCLQGTVLNSSLTEIIISLDSGFPYAIENGFLMIPGHGWKAPVRELIEVDPETGAPALCSVENCGAPPFSKFSCEEIEPGVVKLSNLFTQKIRTDTKVILSSTDKSNPSIHICNCTNIVLNAVNIHQAPSIGITAEYCSNISIKNTTIMPTPGTQRLFSSTWDGIQIVNCRGAISIDNCILENQQHHGISCHGVYVRVSRIEKDGKVFVELLHERQKDTPVAFSGNTIRFLKKEDLRPVTQAEAKKVEKISADTILFHFHPESLGNLNKGDLLENVTFSPTLTIKDTVIRYTNGAGIIAGTAKPISITGNSFSTAGPAFKSTAEATYLFQSGAIADLAITNNTIANSGYLHNAEAIIEIVPRGFYQKMTEQPFQKNIRISGNIIKAVNAAILLVENAAHIHVTENSIHHSLQLASTNSKNTVMTFFDCYSVILSENDFSEEFATGFIVCDRKSREQIMQQSTGILQIKIAQKTQ